MEHVLDLNDPATLDLDALLTGWHAPKRNNEIHIHTSDRILFKRCRRKWNFQSPIRQNLTTGDGPAPAPLWFGSGVHFALEDFHGFNRYGDPRVAFFAYCRSTTNEHPDDFDDLLDLGIGMLRYYRQWAKRFPYETVWLPNQSNQMVPMVEVNACIYLGRAIDPQDGIEKEVYYNLTIDRIVKDADERWYLLDYKTAARYQQHKLAADPQVTAYCWGAKKMYGVAPEGMLYIQLLKKLPGPPLELANGGLSVNKQQGTSYALYAQEVAKRYGTKLADIPIKYVEFLKFLKEREAKEGDPFIKTDLVPRTSVQIDSEEWKINAEIAEMLDPNLVLYPNPTRECGYDCSFQGACLAMDDLVDVQEIIDNSFVQRKEKVSWRKKLPEPQGLKERMQELGLLPKAI